MFRRFDLGESRTSLVDQFYGAGIFLTPKKEVAGRYADANRNIGFPPEILDDLKRANPDAGAFAQALYRKGPAAWDEFAVEQDDGGIRVDEAQVDGLDPNEIGDMVDYVIGSKTKPVGSDSGPLALFSQQTGLPSYLYDLLDTLGLNSFKYRPKVYKVRVKVERPLVTDSRTEAKQARSKGYDSVVYYGRGLVNDVPEVAVFDPRKVSILGVEAW